MKQKWSILPPTQAFLGAALAEDAHSPAPCLNTRGMGVWCECGVGGCAVSGARGQFQGGLGKGSTCGL